MSKKFLIVFYFKKKNGKYDEFTEFKTHLSNSDNQQASVILDLTDRVVVKNILENAQVDFRTLFNHYYPIHRNKIDEFLSR